MFVYIHKLVNIYIYIFLLDKILCQFVIIFLVWLWKHIYIFDKKKKILVDTSPLVRASEQLAGQLRSTSHFNAYLPPGNQLIVKTMYRLNEQRSVLPINNFIKWISRTVRIDNIIPQQSDWTGRWSSLIALY